MKLIFLNLYSGNVERGAESFAHELARRLAEKHQVIFIKGESAIVSQHQFNGNVWQRWFNRKRWFVDPAGLAILWFTWNHLRQVWRERPDWVIPMNGFWQVLLLKFIQPLVGFKILITGHSGPGWDERWNLYLKPNIFVATTQPTLEWAQATCPWTRSTLIPYGIAPGEFFPGEKIKSMKLERPIFLCPSALVEYKRVDLAIRAVADLKNGSLLVVGRGPLAKDLKKLGKRLLGNRFELTSVPYHRMPALYAMSDVVTLPSRPQENSPMVFVEALAAGKPVVATDAPRVRWALESAGWYVDPTHTKLYAKALKAAASTPVTTQKPLTKFLWSSVIKKYERILNS